MYGVVDPLPSRLLDELGLEEEVNWVSLALGPGTGIPGEVVGGPGVGGVSLTRRGMLAPSPGRGSSPLRERGR